MLEVSNI